MDSEEPITRDSVLKLIERKEEIEKKLSQLKVILDKVCLRFITNYN